MAVKTKKNSNRYMFGLGTIGRDMLYTIVSMYLLFFLTDVLDLPDSTMWWMTGAMTILRIFDAVNDPVMGFFVDNTRSRFGKFKPWIVTGGILGGIFTFLLFHDFGLKGAEYITMFVVIYILWDLTYGANDIAYWSMLPSLTLDQKEREKTGSFARICANIGLFTTVVAILPVTNALGGDKRAWQMAVIAVVLITWAFLMFTVLGVKEDKSIKVKQESTSLKEMLRILFRNDQLLFTAISMALFMIGYCTTTAFGVYFFKYAYKDEGMYSVFAAILGVSQLAALSVFPLFSKKYSRKTLYALATILVAAGYVIFFLSPMNMLFIGAAGILLFTGQAFIQLLMLMFLADTVEYGQWKLGRRNESITFSVQPFINKIGGAIANGIVGVTLIVSGINAAKAPEDVTDSGLLIMKFAMLILPLIFIVIGYIIYYKKFKIDKQMYDSIISELAARGEINREQEGHSMLTKKSRIKDVYANPIGRDIINRVLLQMNISQKAVTNPIVENLKLKVLPKLLKSQLDKGFVDTLLTLLNTEHEIVKVNEGQGLKAWWKEAVFYQIYPRSYKDSNGDGIGDLRGIISKLDYIKELGIDAIWLSPIYDSPNDDNGYDIRDYHKIMAEFGTMEDFDQLLAEVHNRDMRLIMDLVVNHTSDEHIWYQKAIHEPDSKYGDCYIFRDQPNNWTSFFSGSAWNYVEERRQYALHLFSKKQMDLNWENETLRQEIHDMIKWWLEKGVDGFRLDVINYISKRSGFPEANESIGKLMGYHGVEHYFYGPRLHEYLQDMKEKVFIPYNAFSVGETPGIGMEMSKLLTADYRKELDMVFSFDHLETPGHTRFEDYQYDLNYLKSFMINWMENYGHHCQPTLFFENHDNPRMISKINSDPQYRNVLGKLLAVIQLTLRGTPFIYQGQELGMINQNFRSTAELRDVESLNLYDELCKTMKKEEAFAKVLAGSRDHARTPMQWNNQQYAGFSTGKPWIMMDKDYKNCNVEIQLQDENSILRFFQNLIALRKEHRVIYYGDVVFINKKEKDLFTYYRKDGTETLYIEMNLSSSNKKRTKYPEGICMLSNYKDGSPSFLRPYEASIWRI